MTDVPEMIDLIDDDTLDARDGRMLQQDAHRQHRQVCRKRGGKKKLSTKKYGRSRDRWRRQLMSAARAERFARKDERRPIEEITLITYEPRPLIHSKGNCIPPKIVPPDEIENEIYPCRSDLDGAATYLGTRFHLDLASL